MALLLSLQVFRDEGSGQELRVSLLEYSCGRVEGNSTQEDLLPN